jgi:hypothetical protein
MSILNQPVSEAAYAQAAKALIAPNDGSYDAISWQLGRAKGVAGLLGSAASMAHFHQRHGELCPGEIAQAAMAIQGSVEAALRLLEGLRRDSRSGRGQGEAP